MRLQAGKNDIFPSQAGWAVSNRLFPLPSPLSPLLCLLLLLAGCPKPGSAPQTHSVARPLEGLKLRLAVADDPALAAAVARVQGEWNAQTGAELQVAQTTEENLLKADALPADAVLCPSHLAGVLAERGLVSPVPAAILRNAEWGGVFELLRLREAAWGKQVVAVPFGSPVLTCYYRADLLEKLGRRPPKTWTEYQEVAKLLATEKGRGERGEGRGKDSWCGTIEPLGPGWAGLVLLARAAPYAKHRDNYSTLFNIDTMEPLVSGPPFVQALEELVAAAKVGPANPFDYDPTKARSAFWRGECGMALTWPTAAKQGRGERGEGGENKGLVASASNKQEPQGLVPSAGNKQEPQGLVASASNKQEPRGLVASATSTPTSDAPTATIRVGFVELPGSRRVFNLGNSTWDTRADDDDPRAPLLAIAGRLGVVGVKSAHADAAFQLLLWLSDSRMSPQVSAASPATTLLRQSNLTSPNQWVEEPVSALAAAQYGDATASALCREQWLGALQLPGRAEYLAALDEAVAVAVRGQKAPLEALLQADKKWRAITARLGLDRQRAAYRHSLGLD